MSVDSNNLGSSKPSIGDPSSLRARRSQSPQDFSSKAPYQATVEDVNEDSASGIIIDEVYAHRYILITTEVFEVSLNIIWV